jgi:hypothetical protein
MPRGEFREFRSTENFSSVFLLPLFFAFTDCARRLVCPNDTSSWLICQRSHLHCDAGQAGRGDGYGATDRNQLD